MEIERKFLIKDLPILIETPYKEIEQAYINDNPEERIRKIGNLYLHTIKSEGTICRLEEEHQITKEQYEQMLQRKIGNLIHKRRYGITLKSGDHAELDIYEGNLAPLQVIEVEFETVDDALDFQPPAWFGKEVSENKTYKNKNLAFYGITQEEK